MRTSLCVVRCSLLVVCFHIACGLGFAVCCLLLVGVVGCVLLVV